MARIPTSNGKAPVLQAPQPSVWDLRLSAERRSRTPEARPANKTEAELRGVYTGTLHDRPSQNCLCLGSGYLDGMYCKCMFNAIQYEHDLRNAQSGTS